MGVSRLLMSTALQRKKTDKLLLFFGLARRPSKEMSGVFTASLWLDAIQARVDSFSKSNHVSVPRIAFLQSATNFVMISIHVSHQLSQSQGPPQG